MFKKPTGKQYRVLAIVWALASAAMAVTIVRRLPQVHPMYLLLLAVSLFISVSSWKTWKLCQQNEKENKFNQNSEEKDND